jgi:VanZ family protein
MRIFSVSATSGRVDGRWLVAAVVYLAVVFFVSSRPYLTPPGPEFPMKDKLAHSLEYAVLAVLLFRALGPLAWPDLAMTFLLVVVVAASVGSADEIFQGMIPGRHKDITDWFSDSTGASIATAACIVLARRSRVVEAR